MKSLITSRHILLVSDNEEYTIESKLCSNMDWYTSDTEKKCYLGSTWTGVIMKHNGKTIPVINGIHFGKYGCGLCQHGVKLSKNLILYGALCTGLFTKALNGIDVEKVTKIFYKEYVQARIAEESELLTI